MDNHLENAITLAQKAEIAYSKFITPNDVGATGGHQQGFHIHQSAWPLLFDKQGEKGANRDKFVTITWQDNFETASRFIYYGVGTRNEYRITRFGKDFPYLNDQHIGDLLVIGKIDELHYHAYVLSTEHEIETFQASLNLSPLDNNKIITHASTPDAKQILEICFKKFVQTLRNNFPSTSALANAAKNCVDQSNKRNAKDIIADPDSYLIELIEAEYSLFRNIENEVYANRIASPFKTVEELVEVSNTILNRRKSRAGKSLEHHLATIFQTAKLPFSTQAITEGNKKPDFLFPDSSSYSDPSFDRNKIFMLASKTTCKDRWRQILNEADYIPTKHLFTLQQGISLNQLNEMYNANVCLVVPRPYLKSFPPEYNGRILSLAQFIECIKSAYSAT
ncbi:type II restriction endonuclease [Chitinophaga rhizosphaerae]|uniref:type II restriction endonuclease n=1 Tax=Chitinophaga rhizosphaerae TaxID=1864947 RepID=UPI000F801BCB|nr:type II restriction endonuclease [Chitinophaga rhizosphaerae]